MSNTTLEFQSFVTRLINIIGCSLAYAEAKYDQVKDMTSDVEVACQHVIDNTKGTTDKKIRIVYPEELMRKISEAHQVLDPLLSNPDWFNSLEEVVAGYNMRHSTKHNPNDAVHGWIHKTL